MHIHSCVAVGQTHEELSCLVMEEGIDGAVGSCRVIWSMESE